MPEWFEEKLIPDAKLGRCPKCGEQTVVFNPNNPHGGDDLQYMGGKGETSFAYFQIKCKACDWHGEEIYKMVFVGVKDGWTETDGFVEFGL